MKLKNNLSVKFKYHAASSLVLFFSQFISVIALTKMLVPSEFSVLGEFIIYTSLALPVISLMWQGYYGKIIYENKGYNETKSTNNTLSFTVFIILSIFGYFYALGFPFMMAVCVSFVRYFITVKRMISLINENHKVFATMTALPGFFLL